MTPMSTNERMRRTIAEEAAEWFTAHREAPLDAAQDSTFVGWLRNSPTHVEEYLGVALVARDLHAALAEPALEREALIVQARAAFASEVGSIGVRAAPGVRFRPLWASAAAAAVLAVCALAFFWGRGQETPASRYATRHGEQLIQQLADGSVLQLNTDSAATVRYEAAERRIDLVQGQAYFKVAHEPRRPFRVTAGVAEVLAVGTQFEVYRQSDATLVTVFEGAVSVTLARRGAGNSRIHEPRVRVSAGQQLEVRADSLPAVPAQADLHRSGAWLRREIVFEHEPLAAVATEFNRYDAKPIEIEEPAVRNLLISGVFSADDTETFIAFLRSLDGVRVEVTAQRIRVLSNQ
jgi:transmembrane sensor